MLESLIRPADPALRRANRIANLGDDLILAKDKWEAAKAAHGENSPQEVAAWNVADKIAAEIAALN